MNDDVIHKIAFDPGFGNTKIAQVRGGQLAIHHFPSVVGAGETELGYLMLTSRRRARGKPDEVTFDGMTYLVGDGVELYDRPLARMDFQRLSSGPELRALLYNALHRLLGVGHHRAVMVVGLPVELLQDTKTAKPAIRELRRWLTDVHRFAVNQENSVVTVHDVVVRAQPVGAFFEHTLDLGGNFRLDRSPKKMGPVAICDIGFNTLDLLTVDAGQVIGRFTGGKTLGMRRAAERLAEALRAHHRIDYSLHQADRMTRQGVNGRPVEIVVAGQRVNVSPLLYQACDMTAHEVLGFVERQWGNGRNFERLLLTGGGAQALSQTLLGHFPHATMLPDPVTANVRGLARFACRSRIFRQLT